MFTIVMDRKLSETTLTQRLKLKKAKDQYILLDQVLALVTQESAKQFECQPKLPISFYQVETLRARGT